MSELSRIAVLETLIEAQALESRLKEKDIPHLIRTHHDSAFDGLFQDAQGWGHIEAAEEHASDILALLEELRNRGQDDST